MSEESRPDDLRVLIYAPTARDSSATSRILGDRGVATHICDSIIDLCREAERGAGAALIAKEHLMTDKQGHVAALLHNQPAWSDFPLIALLRVGQPRPAALEVLKEMGNMTLLPRPVQIASLVSTIQAALRDRRRQYAVRDLLVDRDAVAAELAEDIERRKDAEEQLRQIAADLSEADRRKDEFLAMLAHELRNPLAAVSSAIHLLGLPGTTSEQTVAARDVAERQLIQLKRLIDDLLDISRITRGKIRLRKRHFDLRQAIESAIDASTTLIESRGHQLSVSIGEAPLPVHADPVRIQQVIVNLLTNAAKYTNDGGHIFVTAARDENEHELRVRDTGVGIPENVLPTVFELFTQAPRSLARSEGGLGIGLTLVKALVELHGGTVGVVSRLGDGSEFIARLPAVTSTKAKGPKQSDAAPNAHARRVLIVDDNRDSARMLGILLELSGHSIELAFDGLEAVQAVHRAEPDIVLLDIGLPGLDGYEVAARIRGDQLIRQPLIVAVSGYGQPEDRQRSSAAGMDAHLVKPIDQARLRELLAMGND